MTTKDKTFDYVQWVKNIKVGDKVKPTNCCGSGVKPLNIAGITEKEIIIIEGCNSYRFDPKNGRELGSKYGSYKNGQLLPWTDKDEQSLKEKQLQDKEKDERQKIYELIKKQLNNNPKDLNGVYYLSDIKENFNIGELEKIHKFLKTLVGY
jgi:hypothetical protein